MQCITLTTDFGTEDWFVGTMKGVIAGIAPKTRVVDLTHGIPPGNIRAGAFALKAACGFFPKGTIHVAVVDPGVGGKRRALGVRTANYLFIGPDNGVLSWALAEEEIVEVRVLENEDYFLRPVSRTFHGRDTFAPAAARLSSGVPLRKFGRALKDWVRLPWPETRRGPARIEGEVLYVDRFGNALTNLETEAVQALGQGPLEVWAGRKRVCAVGEFYGAVPPGKAIGVAGSSGFLEIAVNGGSAAEKLGMREGAAVGVRIASCRLKIED